MKKQKEHYVKVEIIATDIIGREEKINLRATTKLAERLKKTVVLGYELEEILDLYRYRSMQGLKSPLITKFQYYKINNFLKLIYHKFYNYTLSIKY